MSLFQIINLFCCLITSIALGSIWYRQRFLFVKPSIIVIVFFHLQIQWATTIDSAYIESYLPNPWVFLLMAQSFPLVGLSISVRLGRESAHSVWKRILTRKSVKTEYRTESIVLLSLYVIFFTSIYLLFYVPFSSTGLYAIIFDPARATIAREESLKLVNSALVGYGYGFMASAFAPLLAVLLQDSLREYVKKRKIFNTLVTIACIASLLFAVSLTGARSFSAMIMLTFVFAWLLKHELKFNAFYFPIALVIVLALPTLFSILREGRTVSLGIFFEYLNNIFLERVLYSPMKVALWYTHFAQTFDFLGIAAIPRLAPIFGIASINAPNLIGQVYTNTTSTVNANTCYVFAYYSYFGLLSLPFSLFGLWLLDIALWVYKQLNDTLLLACVASVTVTSVGFVSTEYTVVLLTHGFMLILILAFVLSKLSKKRKVRTFQDSSSLSFRIKTSHLHIVKKA